MKLLLLLGLLTLSSSAQVVGGLEGLGLNSPVSERETEFTCTSKGVPQKTAQFAGGEGVPPLPLPAVPLRRSEKKNPPTPPVLITKIRTESILDWNTNPGDVENLLRWMAQTLNVNYSSEIKTIDEALYPKQKSYQANTQRKNAL